MLGPGLVQVQLKFNFLELDSEVGRLEDVIISSKPSGQRLGIFTNQQVPTC